MSGAKSGVVPCYEGLIKVGRTAETATTIKDMNNMSISFDNGVEEWNPYGEDGWAKRLPTSKSVTLSISGKRNIGDAGNDFVAGLAFENGQSAMAYFAIVFPDGTEVSWDSAVYSIKTLFMAEATNAAPLEFDVMSNGKPTITAAAQAANTQAANTQAVNTQEG